MRELPCIRSGLPCRSLDHAFAVRAEVSKPCFKSGGGFFDEFRCRSVAAAGDLLFFASPKKPKEKKGDPGVCSGFWGQSPNSPSLWLALRGRCECTAAKSVSDPNNLPAVLAPSGVPLELAALRQSRALIRLKLCSSAHSQGVSLNSDSGSIEPATRAQCCYVSKSCLGTYSLG